MIALVSAMKADIHQTKPEFIRLPRAGRQCPYTGLTRTGLNDLILPTPGQRNPPVRSILLRKRGAQRGVRLIDFDSLIAYLNDQVEGGDA